MKNKYLINSFYFQKQLFEKYLSKYFDFYFSPGFQDNRLRAIFYIPINVFKILCLYFFGDIRKYKVIHFNRPESFLLWKKRSNQLSIFEVHGFDVGVNGIFYLKDLHNKFKYYLGLFLDKIISKKIIRNINKIDLFYCSTPDLVDPIYRWCGRKPIWLPNPIDLSLFSPEGRVNKLIGNPACFLAARLHGDKKPEIAINIFNNYIKKNFPDATLHFIQTGELVDKYKNELTDKNTYFWHEYMTKEELSAKIRGSDLIFGDFSIGALSLLPMQAMALKKPIVTLDNYEIIKVSVENLPDLALKLLNDKNFCQEYIERNYQYILDFHSPKNVSFQHLENIKNAFKNKI